MPARVAINGLGRIGRATLKIAHDEPELELAAVNDIVPPDQLAYLLKYDLVYGRYDAGIGHQAGELIVGGQRYKAFCEREPAKLPWRELNIDLVFECTGLFRRKADAEKHLKAGAKRVIISAPTKTEGIPFVVYGVNHAGSESIVSTASCTTNCIAPVIEVIGRRIGLRKAALTTVHAYTATQALVDGPDKQWRRGRAAAVNLVPTSTGAAEATPRRFPNTRASLTALPFAPLCPLAP